jgi:hypothetical protein
MHDGVRDSTAVASSGKQWQAVAARNSCAMQHGPMDLQHASEDGVDLV